MAQNCAFQLPQTGSGLHPELLTERPCGAPICFECLRLAAASVEREHQLGAQALAEGVCGNEPLELGDERRVVSKGEVCFDPGLERRQTELLETGDLRLSEGLEREVCKCRSSPECEGTPQRRRSQFWVAARELAPAALQQTLEAVCVNVLLAHVQHVAGRLREKQLLAGSVRNESPQS